MSTVQPFHPARQSPGKATLPVSRVEAVRFLSKDIFELVLDRGEVAFQPGNCFAIANADGVSRPYSTSSSTGEKVLRFIIRRMPGGRVSGWLAERSPGDRVQVSAPFGWFRPGYGGEPGAPSVFIATGTGIAPFLSVLKSMPELEPLLCLYGVRSPADAVEREYLQSRCPLRLCISREAVAGYHHGRVTDLLGEMPVLNNANYYLCGLDAMADEVSLWLERQGVHFTRIHREVFFHA